MKIGGKVVLAVFISFLFVEILGELNGGAIALVVILSYGISDMLFRGVAWLLTRKKKNGKNGKRPET